MKREELRLDEPDVGAVMMRIMQACLMEKKSVRYWVMDRDTFTNLRRQEEFWRERRLLNFSTDENVWKAIDVTILTPIYRGTVDQHYVEAIIR